MIGEFWRYWTTFAPERVRRHGYLSRLIALEFRARRCQAAWASHLRRCRVMIIRTAALARRKDVCVVIGSGLLLEVPLEDLAGSFGRVYLVDIFHMPAVRRAVRPFRNVTLLSGDVTGIFAAIKDGYPPGPHVAATEARIPHIAEADLAISCNCLTQLAGPFVAMLGTARDFPDLDADRIAYQIMERHAHAIAHQPRGVGLLISDVERMIVDGVHVVERIDLLKAFKPPPTPTHTHNEEWEWRIAPRGEELPNREVDHLVRAKVYERHAAPPSEPVDDRPTGLPPDGRFADTGPPQ